VRPLRVLHLAANRWWTGSADPVLHLVVALQARGHRVLLGLIPGDRFEARAREAGIEPVAGLALRPRLEPLAFARDVRALRALARGERIDLVHAHQSHDHWLAAVALARRIPVVRTFHNTGAVKGGLASRWLGHRTAAVFAVSRGIERRCHEAGFPPGRVFALPGTADLDRFTPDADPRPVRAEFGLGEVPVVSCVARMAPSRGHDLLLAGFRCLLDKVPDARLLLVGKGEDQRRLERRVAEMALADRVIFTGYRDRDLPDVLAASNCFALMAAGSDESCRAALEAMAAGRPVVARRVGALPETVAHGETGFLVEDDRPESVALALAAVLGDPERAAAMGTAGRRRAECLFGPERVAAISERAYLEVLASDPAR
jgi:glycosyltransferase involved in cell wall biosynthesis